MLGKFKHAGAVHWAHNLAGTKKHAEDAAAQKVQTAQRLAVRPQRRLRRIIVRARRAVRLSVAEGKDPYSTVGVPPPTFFVGLGHGLSTLRSNLPGSWSILAPPPKGRYDRIRSDEPLRVVQWVESKLGPWHSGISGPTGTVRLLRTPQSRQRTTTPFDHRFFYATLTLPAWDTDALRRSHSAGIIVNDDIYGLADAMDQWCEKTGAALLSGYAHHALVYFGGDLHLNDGGVHLHPRFVLSAPLFYHCENLFIPAGAPSGKPSPRAQLYGGEPLGQRSATGRLIPHLLGPALCAAAAWREESLPPSLEIGRSWDNIDQQLALATSRGGGIAPANNEALRTSRPPFDLAGSAHFRQLIRDLAGRNPEFKTLRDASLAEARQRVEAETPRIILQIAGPELAAKDREIAALADEKRAAEEKLRAEHDDAQALQHARAQQEAAAHAAREAALTALADEKNSEVEQLRTQHAAIVTRNQTLEKKVSDSETTLRQLRTEVHALQRQLQDATQQQQRAARESSQARALEAALTAEKSKVAQLRTQHAAAVSDNQTLQEKVSDSETTVLELRARLDAHSQSGFGPARFWQSMTRWFARLIDQIDRPAPSEEDQPLPFGLIRTSESTLGLAPMTRRLVEICLEADPTCLSALTLQSLDQTMRAIAARSKTEEKSPSDPSGPKHD